MGFLNPATVFTSAQRASRRAVTTHPSRRQVCCSAEPTKLSSDARIELWREVTALKKSLEIAVSAERYTDAARLRDQIESLSLTDDYFRLKKELDCAVEEQRFSDAARLRDSLKELTPPPGPAVLRNEREADVGYAKSLHSQDLVKLAPESVSSSSETITHGIKVKVESYYMAEQSVPEHNRFLFGYKVQIKNESNYTCQLVSRFWKIQSAGSPDSEVRGPGVVGRQPVLEPGESFEYTSACPLSVELEEGQSVIGSMSGQYNMCRGDTGAIQFSVDIDRFYLKLPFRNYRDKGSWKAPHSS